MTDPMRERLRDLAERAHGGDDPSLAARVEQRIRLDGPALVRSARRRTLMLQVTGGALLVAAVALLAMRLASPPDTTVRIAAGSRHVAVPPEHRPAEGWIPARACESERVSNDGLELHATADGSSRVDLGVALVVGRAGSEVRIAAREPCRTRVALERGEVVIHARALGGGVLSVATPVADVVVHGTVFSVTVEELAAVRSLRVNVAEGVVGVERSGLELARVHAGGSLVIGASGTAPTEGTLTAREVNALRGVVGLPASAPLAAGNETARAPQVRAPHGEPAQAPGELARLADARWRAGARDEARALYVRAGAGRGADAEGAWISLARHELSGGQPRRALDALARRSVRFANGTLDVDARWLDVQARVALGDLAGASRATESLARAHPREPQVAAARALLARASAARGGAD